MTHRLSLIGLVLVAAVGTTGPAAAASIADARVSMTGTPSGVSPPGGIVLYRMTVANDGPAPAPIDLEDVTAGGTYVAGSSQIPAGCAAPADGTADPVISCSFGVLLPGQTRALAVAIRTPAIVGTVTNTATVRVPPNSFDAFDDNPSNDTASTDTPVTNDADGSRALLAEGDSMTFQAHTLTVRDSDRGVIAGMSVAPAGDDRCGTTSCDEGLRVEFDLDPEYQGTLGLNINFGKGNPCRGIGSGATCTDLYMRKAGVVTLVPVCPVLPTASPCIESVAKDGPVLSWNVRLGSDDPDFIPPLRGSAV